MTCRTHCLRAVFPPTGPSNARVPLARARGEHEGVTSVCRPRVDYYEALVRRVSRSSSAGELLRTRFSPCPAIILVAIAVPEQRGSIRRSSKDRMFLVVAAHCFLRDNCIRGIGWRQSLACIQPGRFKVRPFTQLGTCHVAQCRTHAIDESAFSIGESRRVAGHQFARTNQEHSAMQCIELGGNGATAPRLKVLREEGGPVLSEVLSLGIEGKLLELHRRHSASTLQDVGRDIND